MNTDDLLARLAAEAPEPPLNPAGMVAMVLGGAAAVCALFLALAGVRGDLAGALTQPLVLAKTLWPALLALLALPLAMRLARPDAARVPVVLVLLPIGLGIVLWVIGFATRPPAARFADVTLLYVAECLGFVLLLSGVPVVVALGVLRRGATVRPRLTGALAGLGAAAVATTGYSLYCTQDNPVFYVTWYGAAMALATLAGAVLGGRLLRW